jgi:hypothetical protein
MSNPGGSISKMQIFKTECEFQILFYDAIKLPFCATLSNKENCSGSNNVMDMYNCQIQKAFYLLTFKERF